MHLQFINLDSHEIDQIAFGPIRIVHDLCIGVRIDALVQPGFLKFIGGQKMVPIVVTKFMNDHPFHGS